MGADKLVREFCGAWDRSDLNAIMLAFAEDAVYHNIPVEPCVGAEAIRAVIEGFLSQTPGGIKFDIKLQVSAGNVVVNERVDSFERDGKSISAPVCGVFELNEDGKITNWRDYYDRQQFAGS